MKLYLNPFIDFVHKAGSRKAVNRLSGAAHHLDKNISEILDEIVNSGVPFDKLTDELKTHSEALIRRDFLVFGSADGHSLCLRNPVRQPLFNATIGSLSPTDQAGITWIGVPYGQGNTADVGCQDAPLALRKRSRSLSLDWSTLNNPDHFGLSGLHIAGFPELIESCRFEKRDLYDYGDIVCYHSESQGAVFSRIEATIKALVEFGGVPFMIGGDHSITLPAMRAISSSFDSLHLIHIDAHTDTFSNIFDRKLPSARVNHGNFINHVFQEKLANSTVQIGARGFSNSGSKCSHSNYRILSKDEDLSAITQVIPHRSRVYLTVDVDVLDPVLMCATGHPVPSGMDLILLFRIIDYVSRNYEIAGLDMVEFNPGFSRRQIDTDICLEICLFMSMSALRSRSA